MGGGWRGSHAWAWQSATASGAAGCGIHGHARLEVPHSYDLLPPLPGLESEGVRSLAEDGVGAIIERVEGGYHAAAPNPDEAVVEEISWELAGQLATRIVPGKRKSRSIQG